MKKDGQNWAPGRRQDGNEKWPKRCHPFSAFFANRLSSEDHYRGQISKGTDGTGPVAIDHRQKVFRTNWGSRRGPIFASVTPPRDPTDRTLLVNEQLCPDLSPRVIYGPTARKREPWTWKGGQRRSISVKLGSCSQWISERESSQSMCSLCFQALHRKIKQKYFKDNNFWKYNLEKIFNNRKM